MTTTSLRTTRYAIASLFFLLGVNYGSWAARLPALKLKLGLSEAEIGFFLLGSGLGAVFSFPVTTTLLHRLGAKRLCWLAGATLPTLLVALGFAPTYPVVLLIMVLEGVAAACLNVAMNAQGVAVELAGGRAIMSRLHATFSLGGLAGALIAAGFVHLTPNMPLHFLAAAGLMWGLALWAGRHLLPDPDIEAGSKPQRFSLPGGGAAWLALGVFAATIVEGSMSDWSALYLKERTGASEAMATWGLASFSVAMLCARWLGDGWRSRWGSRRLLMGGALLAAAGLGSALLIGGFWPALAGFVLVGLGVAAASPCLYIAAAKHGPVSLATVTTTGSVGQLLGPPLIGFIAHASHLGWGLALVVIMAFMLAFIATRVDW
ncbi:MFS transporter [Andreprevotia chitinilytica]|uniref:MFS transporter n=1 Tax=Andreprevotia chitinilytica TaxID=396808 RepID=UPI0005593440|nr:MFS transporter [Andreprevotia chitinilytica]